MELRQLRFFVTLAEELHFGRVAQREHIVQSAVSEQIRRLERELGLRLFDRSPRQVRLTAAGDALLPEVRRLFTQVDDITRLAREFHRSQEGQLTVGFSGPAASELTQVILREFQSSFPDVAVRLREYGLNDASAGLHDGSVDVAFVRLPLDCPTDLNQEVLFQEPYVAAVPADHRLARRKVLSHDQLLGERMLAWVGGSVLAQHHLSVVSDSEERIGEIERARIGTVAELLDTVALGRGVALVPASYARFYDWPCVSFVALLGFPLSEAAVAWPEVGASTFVAAFADVARNCARRAGHSGQRTERSAVE